jgi:dihydrofolate reductase
MTRLIYMLNVSLDGYVETPEHALDWANVDEELHGWFNDRTRELDASLYGRRMYELMAGYWPTAESDPAASPAMREFAAIWTRLPKIVFSSSLTSVGDNSRLVSGDVGEILASLRTEFRGDLDVGGPTLAAEFIRWGLIDEYGLVVHPVVLGAGTPFFPPLENRLNLRQIDSRRFASGATYLGYVPA